MTSIPPPDDDNDLLALGDDSGLPPGGTHDLPGSPISKKDRVVPRVAEKTLYNDDGTTSENKDIPPFFWGRAHHNLSGFEQPGRVIQERQIVGTDPVTLEDITEIKDVPVTDEAGRPRGLHVGEAGWIPNTEEGVHAVEVGFVKVEEPPENAHPMPPVPKVPVLDL